MATAMKRWPSCNTRSSVASDCLESLDKCSLLASSPEPADFEPRGLSSGHDFAVRLLWEAGGGLTEMPSSKAMRMSKVSGTFGPINLSSETCESPGHQVRTEDAVARKPSTCRCTGATTEQVPHEQQELSHCTSSPTGTALRHLVLAQSHNRESGVSRSQRAISVCDRLRNEQVEAIRRANETLDAITRLGDLEADFQNLVFSPPRPERRRRVDVTTTGTMTDAGNESSSTREEALKAELEHTSARLEVLQQEIRSLNTMVSLNGPPLNKSMLYFICVNVHSPATKFKDIIRVYRDVMISVKARRNTHAKLSILWYGGGPIKWLNGTRDEPVLVSDITADWLNLTMTARDGHENCPQALYQVYKLCTNKTGFDDSSIILIGGGDVEDTQAAHVLLSKICAGLRKNHVRIHSVVVGTCKRRSSKGRAWSTQRIAEETNGLVYYENNYVGGLDNILD